MEKKLDNAELFKRQMDTLKILLNNGAISPEQYKKSSDGLKKKMKI